MPRSQRLIEERISVERIGAYFVEAWRYCGDNLPRKIRKKLVGKTEVVFNEIKPARNWREGEERKAKSDGRKAKGVFIALHLSLFAFLLLALCAFTPRPSPYTFPRTIPNFPILYRNVCSAMRSARAVLAIFQLPATSALRMTCSSYSARLSFKGLTASASGG